MSKMYNYSKKKIRHSVEQVGEIQPDLQLLKILIEKQSPSNTKEEMQFVQWLAQYCLNKGYKVEKDSNRNIYVTKGATEIYPCIVAHTDTNQDLHSSLELVQIGDLLIGWNKITATQCGAGFDDKIGILIALQCLEIFDNIKVFFPSLEEVGYVGSSKANMEFFENVGYCFQPDRNSGKNDICTFTNGIDTADSKFINSLRPILDIYDYKEASGVGTDIGELKWKGLKCSAVNVSCGYFREHSDEEVCSVSLLHNCLNFIVSSIEHIGETFFHHEAETKTSKKNKNYNGYYDGFYGAYEDFTEELNAVDEVTDVWYVQVKNELIQASLDEREFLDYEHCPDCIIALNVVSWTDEQDTIEWQCNGCRTKYISMHVSNKSNQTNSGQW